MTVGLLISMKRIELALKSFMYSSLVLAVLGIYQYFSGNFFWNEDLANWGNTGMNRINVTFSDPNILARYLAILIIMSWTLVDTSLVARPVLQACLLAGFAALLFTFSRSGWLLVPVGLAVTWWYSTRATRAKIVGRALIVGTLAVVLFVSIGALTERGESLAGGSGALGSRLALIETGFQMFRDHPALGVGFGSFGRVALEDYTEFLPYGGQAAYLSHTALVTVMAELGTVGLALTFWIFRAIYKSFRRTLTAGKEPHKTYALTCFVAIPLIVLSAQSKGACLRNPSYGSSWEYSLHWKGCGRMHLCLLADAGSLHTQRWAKYLAGRGHNVHLLSFREAPICTEKVTIHKLRRSFLSKLHIRRPSSRSESSSLRFVRRSSTRTMRRAMDSWELSPASTLLWCPFGEAKCSTFRESRLYIVGSSS